MLNQRVKFNYPLFRVAAVAPDTIVVAGGGGSSKTGIPNRIDILHMDRPVDSHTQRARSMHSSPKVVGGMDTSPQAIMNMAIAGSIGRSSADFLVSAEGDSCVEYQINRFSFVKNSENFLEQSLNHGRHFECVENSPDLSSVSHRKTSFNASSSTNHSLLQTDSLMAWDISPLRQFVLPPVVDDQAMRHHSGHGSRPSLSDESPRGAPNCLAANGLGAACLAIGTDQGAVWLVDRYSVSPIHFPDNQQLQPFLVLSDVSGGRRAEVFDIDFAPSLFNTSKRLSANGHLSENFLSDSCLNEDISEPPLLLATVCERPDGGTLRIWRIPFPPSANSGILPKSLRAISRLKGRPATKRSVKNARLMHADTHHSVYSHQQQKSRPDYRLLDDLPSSGRTFEASESSLNPDASVLQGAVILEESVPHAEAWASKEQIRIPVQESPKDSLNSPTMNRKTIVKSAYRFRHCRFFPWVSSQVKHSQVGSESLHKTNTALLATPHCLLAATVQPVVPNSKSTSYLKIFVVPYALHFEDNSALPNGFCKQDISEKLKDSIDTSPLNHEEVSKTHIAECVATVSMAQGHLPACIAVHPFSRSQLLCAIGTMEGRVDVYLFMPLVRELVNVYSVPKAHPIFVTSLAFLPVRRNLIETKMELSPCCNKVVSGSELLEPIHKSQTNSAVTSSPHISTTYSEEHFELVSVSVDQNLCWHQGPSYSQVVALAELHAANFRNRRSLLRSTASFLGGLTWLLFPLVFALVDRLAIWLF